MTRLLAGTRLILIRHGETAWNLEGRYQGQLDSPLTERGLAQARAVGLRLRQLCVDHLYTSDLGRAMETARVISEATGHPVIPDQRLRERHFGLFHGLSREAIRLQRPAEYAEYARGSAEYAIPGGESLQQLHQRAVCCMEELAGRHAGRCLVVVGHGGSLGAMIKHVLGLPAGPARPFRLFNAGLNIVEHEGGRWLLERLGDVAHLERLEAGDEPE